MRDTVVFESCPNFRDLGGLETASGRKVREGVLFRSDVVSALSDEDAARFRDEVGVRELVDLRSQAEHDHINPGSLGAAPARVHHLPIIAGDAHPEEREALRHSLGATYMAIAKHRGAPIAQVLQTLSEMTRPTVFFCAAGKDRTGMIAALVLGLLGVPADTIVDDYAETGRRLEPVLLRLARLKGVKISRAQMHDDGLAAAPKSMRHFLAGLEEHHGGIPGYVSHIGVSSDAVARLAERLLL